MLFSFLYNLILVLIYVVVGQQCLTTYLRTKKSLYLYLSLLHLAWLFDAVMIFTVAFVGENVSNISIHSPIYKVLITMAIIACYIPLMYQFLQLQITPISFWPLLFYFITSSMITASQPSETAWTSWVFYSLRWFALFFMCVEFFVRYHSIEEPERKEALKPYRYFVWFLTGTMIISLIEQTIVIFDLSHLYIFAHRSFLYERSLTEDLYSIVVDFLIIWVYNKDLYGIVEEQAIPVPPPAPKLSNPRLEQLNQVCIEYQLTSRERDVLALLIENYTSQEIAEQLIISQGTVKTHTHNIYQKLGVEKKNQLLRMFATN